MSVDVHEVLIVMELYEGTPVIDLLNQCLSAGRSLGEEKVVKIFLDVCQAVARLHHRTKPILHRDLKVSVCCIVEERERESEREVGGGGGGRGEMKVKEVGDEGRGGRKRLKVLNFTFPC